MENSLPTIDFAPMEGVTHSIYRVAHAQQFSGVSRYYAPFLSPGKDGCFSEKELREVLPRNNPGVPLIPQLLTAVPEHFLWAARVLEQLGYEEVNLNLGCPSGTVTAKHKGAGFLADPAALDAFFDKVFAASPVRVSVKTRLGMTTSDEFPRLLEIYNRYPIAELIVHPRTGSEFYRGAPHWDAFRLAAEDSRAPVCYNGNLFDQKAAEAFFVAFPTVRRVMVGRGLAANPALAQQLLGGAPLTDGGLRAFHDAVYEGYCRVIVGERNILFKMKELWGYFLCLFPDSRGLGKAIQKAQRLTAYEAAVAALFAQRQIDPNRGYLTEM